METRVCFARAFAKLEGKSVSAKYTIKVYKEDALRKINGSNMCYLTRKQIKNHIDQLKDLFPIKSSVIDSKDKRKPYFVVTIELKNLRGTYHKYALTWLRYLYEYPYNVILLDAYRLKQDPVFRFESIANLFNLVASCSATWIGEGHAVVGNSPVGFLRRKELLARLNSVRSLNSVYTRLGVERKRVPGVIDEYHYRDLEYWNNDNFFKEKRKPVYMEEYAKLKNKR